MLSVLFVSNYNLSDKFSEFYHDFTKNIFEAGVKTLYYFKETFFNEVLF